MRPSTLCMLSVLLGGGALMLTEGKAVCDLSTTCCCGSPLQLSVLLCTAFLPAPGGRPSMARMAPLRATYKVTLEV
jgi:hypothetical protein